MIAFSYSICKVTANKLVSRTKHVFASGQQCPLPHDLPHTAKRPVNSSKNHAFTHVSRAMKSCPRIADVISRFARMLIFPAIAVRIPLDVAQHSEMISPTIPI
ncbi:hypothetical protein [Bradyrhizobium sp. 164]|uniref:hypothetical protein n=1 Tax=Bradyrhizobium sp. 164 TaxID=2782637 RepID=UPI001FF9F4CF|nr:hypothetical protein [Bradyrhizobium sp. 164]MCK1599104.1 hypothetical protein [Bradyrhizobium sp. 164]